MFFPSLCFGCEENTVDAEEMICMHCRFSLPFTSFEKIRNNIVEKLFWGRVPLRFAASTFYFTERSSIQNIIHHIKYRDEKDLGIFMGEMMGEKLTDLFAEHQIDCCIPMPLHPKKKNNADTIRRHCFVKAFRARQVCPSKNFCWKEKCIHQHKPKNPELRDGIMSPLSLR